MWVLCSFKPLKSKVLLEAIQYAVQGSTVVRKEELAEQQILSLCQDFLTIDEERGVWMLPHASVAEYFELKEWTSWKCDIFASRICLGFLENFEPEKAVDNTFARYVDYNWYEHVGRYDKWLGSMKEEEADPGLVAALKHFLGSPEDSSGQYRKWTEKKTSMRPANMALFAVCRYGFHCIWSDWWRDGEITERMALRKNEFGENSLALAAEGNCMLICRHLVDLIDVKHPDAQRHAGALIIAISRSNLDVVKFLVMEANGDVNFSPDPRGKTAAQFAAECKPKVLQWLVDQDVIDLEKENGNGYMYSNVLIAAAGGRNVESVRILLKAGADVNAAVQHGKYGSALAAAAEKSHRNGYVRVVRLLLNRGADPNLPLKVGKYGSVLEALICNYSQSDKVKRILQMLLEAGADPTAVLDRGEHGNAKTQCQIFCSHIPTLTSTAYVCTAYAIFTVDSATRAKKNCAGNHRELD